MGRHLHRNEDWEWAQATTKSCGRDVQLPTADDHQRCSTPSTRGRLCQIGLVRMPSRWSATIFIACISLRDRSHSFSTFSIFSTFRFWIPRQAIHQHQLIPLISRYIPSLMIDHPNHRGVYSQVNSFVAIATSLSPIFGPAEKRGLARLGNLRELHESLQAWPYAMDCCGQWTF